MNEVELRELVAKILVLEASAISLNSNLQALGWDSLSNLSFISEIDDKLNKQVSAEKLGNAETVNDLMQLLNP